MENNYGRNCPLDRFEYLVDFEARRYEKRTSENITQESASFLEGIVERETSSPGFMDGVAERDLF